MQKYLKNRSAPQSGHCPRPPHRTNTKCMMCYHLQPASLLTSCPNTKSALRPCRRPAHIGLHTQYKTCNASPAHVQLAVCYTATPTGCIFPSRSCITSKAATRPAAAAAGGALYKDAMPNSHLPADQHQKLVHTFPFGMPTPTALDREFYRSSIFPRHIANCLS
jgi:hypothetical protein